MGADHGAAGPVRLKPLRWRKDPKSGYGAAETHSLCRGAETIAKVQHHRGGGWFWYTLASSVPFRNTGQAPVRELADAKAAAQRHVADAGRAALEGGA